MIYDLLTSGQWFVIFTIIFIVAGVIAEIGLAYDEPWRDRGDFADSPPPLVGGIIVGAITAIGIGLLLGIIHGLTYMWIYG